jgi:hypothetical protein
VVTGEIGQKKRTKKETVQWKWKLRIYF